MWPLFGRMVRNLAIFSAVSLLWLVLGAIVSLIIILLYVNSSAYCRDCDTGLGLCGIGYCLGTIIMVVLLMRFPAQISIKRKNADNMNSALSRGESANDE